LPLLRAKSLRGFAGDLKMPENEEGLPDNVLLTAQRGYLTDTALRIKHNTLLFYLQKLTGSNSQRVFIAQSGETDWIAQGRFQGRSDSPITVAGKRYALSLAEYLLASNVHVVLSSPQGASRQTADIIARAAGVPLVEIPAFAEMDFGIFEGKSRTEVVAMFGEFCAARERNVSSKLFTASPGGESYFDVYLRVLDPLLEYLAKGQSFVVVGHESVNRIVRGIVAERPLHEMIEYQQHANELACYDMAAGVESIVHLES
jgi:broad specificity phosphatase PhoE